MRNFFKRLLTKEDVKKPFVYTTAHMAEQTGNGARISRRSNTINNGNFISIDSLTTNNQEWGISGSLVSVSGGTGQTQTKVDERKAVEPKEVFEEIKTESPAISFDNLDEKIEAVGNRIEILKEHLDESHLGDEQKTLFYLKNRRKYLETRMKNPLDWAMTTTEAIDDLCKRYKLKIVPLKQFYTLVPEEGIKEMNRYTKCYKAITGDKPIFELIVKDTEEAKTEQRKKDRDPILVANSPLGNHLYIIGVWDEEVAIVDEIIYGLK